MASKNTATDEQKWAALEAELKDDPAKLSLFYENPASFLKAAGIEMVLVPPAQIDARKTLRGVKTADKGLRVKRYWWGQDFIMNEKLTSDIVSGIQGIGSIAGIIAAASGIGAVLSAGIAAGFVLKMVEIKFVDRGKGVHWPITWAQWLALGLAVPGGPGAVTAAAALWLHPLRN